MIFSRINTYFIIYCIVLLRVFSLESDKSASVTFQVYTPEREVKEANVVPLSVVIDVKNNTTGKDAYISIPLSLKYLKTVDEPRSIESSPQNITSGDKDKLMCNKFFDNVEESSLAKLSLGGYYEEEDDNDDEDDDSDDEEEEEESCSSDKITASLKALTHLEKRRIGIKLKSDLEEPISEDKLKAYSSDQLIKINLPKEKGVVANGKYLWNILLSHNDNNVYNFDPKERLNWYLVLTADGEVEIPDYKAEESLLSYRYLLQALKMKKNKITSAFSLSLEKTKVYNVDLVPKLSTNVVVNDKDMTISFKAPKHNYYNNKGVSLMVVYNGDSKLCDKIEFMNSDSKISIGSCEECKKCKGGIILSKFDKELVKDAEYTLNVKNVNIEYGGNVEVTLFENDPQDSAEIVNKVPEVCKTLFEYSYVKYTPFIISYNLLDIPIRHIKTRLYIHQDPYNRYYLYGILDLPKLEVEGDYKVIIENESDDSEGNLEFFSNNELSESVTGPKLPNNYTVDSKNNRMEIVVKNDPNKYISIPLLLKNTSYSINNNIKVLINSVNNKSSIIGDVEIIDSKVGNDLLQIAGPRFMDKNTIIFTFNNVKQGDYLLQLEAETNLFDKCGQVNTTHEAAVRANCSDKSVKVYISLPRDQQKIDFKLNVKHYGSKDDLTFSLWNGGRKYISYKINLQQLFEEVELDDAICVSSQKSSISGSIMMSSFKLLKCATPWKSLEYYRHRPNLYLLDENNKLIKEDSHIIRYNTDSLSNNVLSESMPITLYILSDSTDVESSRLCSSFLCKTERISDNLKEQIDKIFARKTSDSGEVVIAIVTADDRIVDKVKKLPQPTKKTNHLFIPLFLIKQKSTNSSFQYNINSPNYLEPKRLAPLYQNDPTQLANVISREVGENTLHFGVSTFESINYAMIGMEELLNTTILPTWIKYFSCVNSGKVDVNYMDKKLFTIEGEYEKDYCDYLTLLTNVQIESQV